jgi:hypothetical protein
VQGQQAGFGRVGHPVTLPVGTAAVGRYKVGE